MPIQSNTPPVQRGTGGRRIHLAAALVVATLGLQSESSVATESAGITVSQMLERIVTLMPLGR